MKKKGNQLDIPFIHHQESLFPGARAHCTWNLSWVQNENTLWMRHSSIAGYMHWRKPTVNPHGLGENMPNPT